MVDYSVVLLLLQLVTEPASLVGTVAHEPRP